MFQSRHTTVDGPDAAQPCGLDASLHVDIKKRCDALRRDISRLSWRARTLRITSGLDLADEETFPMARLLHRLDRPLLAWIHSWDGEVVRGDPIARAAVHHVEPQMLQAASGCRAPASASSYD